MSSMYVLYVSVWVCVSTLWAPRGIKFRCESAVVLPHHLCTSYDKLYSFICLTFNFNSSVDLLLNRVRALIDAYLVAFDRHYNMLLSDVDEEYVTNKQGTMKRGSSRVAHRASAEGAPAKVKKTFKRHVAQMLVRGETVVLVHALGRL